jgi:hypothetical protein
MKPVEQLSSWFLWSLLPPSPLHRFPNLPLFHSSKLPFHPALLLFAQKMFHIACMHRLCFHHGSGKTLSGFK